MGLLDDLAMGFGFKERTKDYDARTARNIAASDATRNIKSDHERTIAEIRLRNDPNFDYSNYTRRTSTGYDTGYSPSREYLDRAGARGGYKAGTYTPAIAEDNRPFFQRAIFSPESSPSPNPYAIGPLSMDQPLRVPSILGILTKMAKSTSRRPNAGKPLPSGAIAALEGGTLKAPNKVATPLSILPADDGQITEEELADVTGEDALGTFTPEEMETADLLAELNARFDATGDDPTVGIDRQPLYDAGYSDGFIDRLTQDDRNKIFAMHVGKAFR